MAKPRASYPENRKEVYKFWLGFFEKITIVLVTVVILPKVLNQLQYPTSLLMLPIIVIILFLSAMLYLSRKLLYLPKDLKKEQKDE